MNCKCVDNIRLYQSPITEDWIYIEGPVGYYVTSDYMKRFQIITVFMEYLIDKYDFERVILIDKDKLTELQKVLPSIK